MATKKYTDWLSWWDGLRTNLLKCIGTTGIAWLGTNAAAGSGVPIHGLDWEQAGTIFMVHISFEVFTYLKDNQPKVIVEQTDTTFSTKSPSGVVTEQSSTKTITTPVIPIDK